MSIQLVVDNSNFNFWESINKSGGIAKIFDSPLFTEIGPKVFVIAGGRTSLKYIQNSFEYTFLLHESLLINCIQTGFHIIDGISLMFNKEFVLLKFKFLIVQ